MLIFNWEECMLSVERRYLEMDEVEIGKVTDFFAKPVVAGIELSGTLKIGDKIHIKGSTTDMELAIESMQIERVNITEGKPGDLVGIKVPDRVRRGDKVYKVTE
jgi:putative protease